MQIGNVVLENNLILAPMAGVTDLPFSFAVQGTGGGASVYGDDQCEGHLFRKQEYRGTHGNR